MDAYDVFVMRFESNVNRRYLPIPGLRRVFGIDQESAEKIAQNLPRVVKRRVTLEVAARYAEALREIGAEVELRPCQDPSNPSQSTPPATRESVPSSSPDVSPSGSNESSDANQVQVDATQETPDVTGNAPATASASTPDNSELNTEPQSDEKPDGQIPLQPSPTDDRETPESGDAQSDQRKSDNFSNDGSNEPHDDSRSRTSTRPSAELDTSSNGSIRPLPLQQQEQNVQQQEQNATRAQEVASPTANKSIATNLSQRTANVWPNATNIAFDPDSSTRPSTADRSTGALSRMTLPLGNSPSEFPTNTASTKERDPAETLKKSFWAPGTGYVLAGSVLILIGLLYDGSIFIGNAGIIDVFFDVLGLCWIVWGLFKLVKKRSRLQMG